MLLRRRDTHQRSFIEIFMQLKMLTDVLREARKNGTALAAFNVPGADAMRSVAAASASNSSPAIIQTSLTTVKTFGTELLKGWFDVAKSVTGAQIYLHLDHCSEPDIISGCINAGWDMVMYDGSHLPFESNLSNTQEIVHLAHQSGVAVEAELGGIGGAEDGAEQHATVANIEEIVEFSSASGADCLAIGFGNVHGHYATTTNLRWDILKDANQSVSLPFVLHGGTGLTDDELLLAIRYGCAKVNISTALKDVYASLLANSTLSDEIKKNPLRFHEALYRDCYAVCSQYIKLTGSP